MADNSVTGVMVTLIGDETPLTGTLTGNNISVLGGNHSFTLTFDSDGTDPSNDLALGTTSGFIGTMTNASGTVSHHPGGCKKHQDGRGPQRVSADADQDNI